MRKTQYVIFGLKAAQAQDKALEERIDGKTKDFKKYCNIPGMCISAINVFEQKDRIEEERAECKKAREISSHDKRG